MPQAIVKTAATVFALLPMLLFSANVAQGEIVLEPLPPPKQGGGMSTPAQPVVPQLPLFVEPAKPPALSCPAPKFEEEPAEKPATPENNTDPCSSLDTRLPYLPEIMDHLGWTNGEALMRDWFSRAANDDPKQDTNPNIDTIKMDWVLGYERAREVYDQAIAEKVWVNAAARKGIEDDLIRGEGKLPVNVGDVMTFGDVGVGQSFTPAQMLQFDEDYYFQSRPVYSDLLSDPLDDLFAALANFNFHFVTQGTVERLPDVNGNPRYRVVLDKVGIYVQDSYDFNDNSAALSNPKTWISQPLGFWDCKDQDATKTWRPGSKYVDNESFREWRDNHGNGKGGDFLVFSDIKVINVNDTFEF